MRKLFLASITMTLLFTAFAACSKEGEGEDRNENLQKGYEIEVTGLTGIDDVVRIKAMAIYATQRFPKELAVAYNENGKFTIELPNPVATEHLETITPIMLNLPEGVAMSPASVKGVIADFWAYNGRGKLIGSFEMLEPEDIMAAVARYYYMEQPTTITGTYADQEGNEWVYDVSFSKGWNLVYQTQKKSPANTRDMINVITTMSTEKIMSEEWIYLEL